MAAVEARDVWHWSTNHGRVLEDANLASSPSSTRSNGSSDVIHFNNPFKTKWWLQLQPNFECLKDINSDQLCSLEYETDEKSLVTVAPTSMSDGKPLPIDTFDDVLKQEECLLEFPPMVSTDLKNSSRTLVKEIKMTTNCPHKPLKQKPDMEFVYKEEEFLGLKPDEQLPSRRIDKALELGSPWAAINKSEPWWHVTDKDDLALLVARKSLHHIENCDLPKPTQVVLNDNVDGNGVFQPPLGRTARTGMCDANDDSHDPSSPWRLDDKDISPHQRWYEQHGSRKLHSFDRGCAENRLPEGNQTTEKNDPTRARLREALHYSQTQARKAEMSAQKAYKEKDHVVKLSFRRASQLCAYKQWLHMLQFEELISAVQDIGAPNINSVPHTSLDAFAGFAFGHGQESEEEREERQRSEMHSRRLCGRVGFGWRWVALWLDYWLFVLCVDC